MPRDEGPLSLPPHAPSERPIAPPAGHEAPRATLHAMLARLDIPRDIAAVLSVWPRADGGLEVHLSAAAFWRAVARHGLAVRTIEDLDHLSRYRHAVLVDGLELVTRTAEAVLPPGVLTPGYVLRLT